MTKTKALQTTVTPLSTDDIASLLGESGDLGTGSSFHRLNLKAGMLVTENEDYYPSKGMKEPAVIVRIVTPPTYYNAWYLTTEQGDGNFDPNLIGRPDLMGRFAKKYDNPEDQKNDQWANLDAYDAIEAATGKRGKFKGDMQVQLMPPDGQFKGDETVYTLTLATTSCLDFRGTSKNRQGGIAQDKNFIIQLAEFAASEAAEAGGDEFAQKQAVMRAMSALKTGGVVAGLYLPVVTRDNNSWTIIAFKPIYVDMGDEASAPALEDGTTNGDDLPV